MKARQASIDQLPPSASLLRTSQATSFGSFHPASEPSIMAARATSYWRRMVSQLGGINHRTISTVPSRMKSVAAPMYPSHITPRSVKGEYVPVCVVLGMICLSVSLGLYTAQHQLRHAPNVFVKKKKRETIPEVVEPEHVVEESERFLTKNLMRRIAHLLDMEEIVDHPIEGDPFKIPKRAETLKTVGVDPKAI